MYCDIIRNNNFLSNEKSIYLSLRILFNPLWLSKRLLCSLVCSSQDDDNSTNVMLLKFRVVFLRTRAIITEIMVNSLQDI